MASIASRSAESPSLSASLASTRPTSVDSKQDDDLPTIHFTNVQDLFGTIDCATGDFLAVTHVSPSNFTEIEREREKQRRKFRFRRYHSNRQLLLITIPTDVHDTLHLGIYMRFYAQLVRSGREHDWKTIGPATRPAQQDHPRGDGGEGDSTGGPKPDRATKGAWPTLVIDAGFSESLNGLHHQVKIILLAKFEHARRTIILEKWEEEARSTRPGAMTTRYAAAVQPILQQIITITKDLTTDPVSYNVTSGALVLGFRLLFLRDPGPGEGDFVLSVQELEGYAEDVWASL
ncbi:uncharacterized protein C8A04DRAFT_35377 [Dichotomopilus funicola]|uniref:Uncharacterized protein n=1 Tax=Dichotomopilus funicola TaxID=1934379 RepID=A0AAN6ZNH1_9PEZI|nr:hypothetical protein C8A04DRAFT_35377 [Dichotomopilus funicola]